MNSLKDLLKDKDGGAILDVGTGYGDFLFELTESFKTYKKAVGVDISTERLEKAREKYPDFIFEANAVDQLNYADNSYDTVAISHSLHHLKYPKKILAEMNRVLKPGGMFIIREVFQTPENEKPNSQRHIHHFWARTDQLKDISHYETYTPNEIKDLSAFLNLHHTVSFNVVDAPTAEEAPSILESMIKHTSEITEELKQAGQHPELVTEGEELVKRFTKQGVVYEEALIILGNKQ